MSRLPVRATAAIVSGLSLLSLVGLAQPAEAKGGGGATPPPTTAPAAPPLDCFGDPAVVAITTPDIAVNYAGDAGCVGVRVSPSSLSLAWVVLNDGWSYVVKSNGGGTNSRVQLAFTQAGTGRKIDFRFEFGKTVIG